MSLREQEALVLRINSVEEKTVVGAQRATESVTADVAFVRKACRNSRENDYMNSSPDEPINLYACIWRRMVAASQWAFHFCGQDRAA
ncbi:hypothetical protein SeMB42_g04829 [Synchytrium endobioticum]|uniref:Uncharacterized protein n=1 Tax=Synchytrium endobioticum TaxID=286115 RepID=A0A507CVY5_9FUNG|nr:hypothetical protein SeMB42_g04829 [Synchytrium endobioticum]